MPRPDIAGEAPIALFSKLGPHTRIPAHTGMVNTLLTCHLPLIVPENSAAIRVGNEERPWVEGELLDDDTGSNVTLGKAWYVYDAIGRLERQEIARFDPNTETLNESTTPRSVSSVAYADNSQVLTTTDAT